MHNPASRRLDRRGFLAAAGLAAGSAAGLATPPSPAAATAAPAGSTGFADAVIAAFNTYPLVALGAADNLQEHYDALNSLLHDPRAPGVINAIVVEWGNPVHQNTIDRFVAGQPVADADLRAVWRNTTQSPVDTWDEPVYEQFYRTVRAVNWRLPASQQIRVLLGDTPIDWTKITTARQLHRLANRDTYVTSLVQKQVLARHQRALLCYGMNGLFKGTGLTGAIEQHTHTSIYVIADLVAPTHSNLASQLASYTRDSVIPTASTWLGQVDAGPVVQHTTPGTNGNQHNPFNGTPLSKLIDAGLYPGPPQDLTMSWPDPDIYHNPTYWAELQRRNALSGNRVDLNRLRQNHAPQYGQ